MCKKLKYDHTNKWHMNKPAPVLENKTHKLQWDFNIHTDHLFWARRPDLIIINNKKENFQNCRLCCPGWPQNKTERKRDKYLDLARELKKVWNMQLTIIPIIIGAFGTVTKGLQKGLDDFEGSGRMETIQTTTLLKTDRILRRVLETRGDLLSLKL